MERQIAVGGTGGAAAGAPLTLELAPPQRGDPDGYLRQLSDRIPSINPIIVTYLNECLRTFRIDCLLSSKIALGCAAEKARLMLLIAAYDDSLGEGRQKNKTDRGMIKRQFDALRDAFRSELRTRPPSDLDDGIDIALNGIFDFIRTQRKDASHPTGKTVERGQAYANLYVFPVYLRKVYELFGWLGANPSREPPLER